MTDHDSLQRSGPSGTGSTPLAMADAAFQDGFLKLLTRRLGIYTQGDSASVPAHVAYDALQSVCFILGIDPDTLEVPAHLLAVDLEAEFSRRLADVERKVALAGQLWLEATRTAPQIPNIALTDTLAAIGDFPKAYDFRSMAHEISCSFDYPLCHWVSDDLVGVDYINEYLRRLTRENEFLGRFERAACERVLAATTPDFVEAVINLYEPVATNAIGRALIGCDPRPLTCGDADRARIAQALAPLGQAQREHALREAALAVCAELGIGDAFAQEYLCDIVPGLLPRIDVALEAGSLRGVFV